MLCSPVGPLFAAQPPWSLPFAPPAPPRSGPRCSPASPGECHRHSSGSLLLQGLTSRVRASSATAPRLPDAGRAALKPLGQPRDLSGSDLFLLCVMGSLTTTECRRLASRHRTYCLRHWGTSSASVTTKLSRLNIPPHIIAVYASWPPSPTGHATLATGRLLALPGPDLHRLDQFSLS